MTQAPIHPRHKDDAAKAMEQVKAEPVELKPCPFCGGEAVLRSVNLPMAADCTDIYISCWNCDVNGPGILFDQDTHHAGNIPALEAEAIAAWNQRANPQPAAVDGLVEAANYGDETIQRAVMASVNLGKWMSAALDDPDVCDAMKADIQEWFSAGEPVQLMAQALAQIERKPEDGNPN